MTTFVATRASATVDGLRIAYEDAGTGSPALVLIHGAFGDRSHYAQQTAYFAKRHRVIALDLRGHGESDVPSDGIRVRDFARDVVGTCRAAGIERAVFCGHSIGGAIALEAAASDPELAAGVVLLDGAVLFPDAALAGHLAAFTAALEGDGWLKALEDFFGVRMFTPYDAPELKERILRELARAKREMTPMFKDLFATDYATAISSSTYPLLFVHSRIPVDVARLRQLRPDAFVGEVVGAGHYAMLEVPDQINAMLARFLQIVAARAVGGATSA